MNPEILIFEDTAKLNEHLFEKWVALANQSIKTSGQFTVALSGGKTPGAFYKKLTFLKDKDIWSKTHLFQVDERFVASHKYESNFRTIDEYLLNYIPSTNIHAVKTDAVDVTAAAEEYEKQLRDFFNLKDNQFPQFDLILLGIGEDGHTASLFPGDPAVTENKKLAIGVSAKHLTNERISLTLPVINSARHIVFMVTGANKAGIVRRIIMNRADLPAAYVEPTGGHLYYLLDQSAGQKMREAQ